MTCVGWRAAETEDPRHRQLRVIVDDAPRFAAEVVYRVRCATAQIRLRRLSPDRSA